MGRAPPRAAQGKRSLAWAVAGFELRHQLGSPVVAVVVAISVLMVLGSATIDALRIGPLAAVDPPGSPLAVARVYLVWTLFFLFTSMAFVADAVLRDDITGFGAIVRATPARVPDDLLGRFAGAFAVVALCFMNVPIGLALAGWAPWIDQPPDAASIPWGRQAQVHGFALLVLALPNLLLGAALFFALATLVRSMGAAYLGAVALLLAYGLGAGPSPSSAQPTTSAALLEPFGFAALAAATQGWTEAERASRLPMLSGVLLWNRVVWLAASLALLWAACGLYRVEPRRRAPGASPSAPSSAGARPRTRAMEDASRGPSSVGTAAAPSFGRATAVAQYVARTRLETRRVFGTPAFAALMLMGLANAVASLWSATDPAAPQRLDDSAALAQRLVEAFRLAPVAVALLYSGDLVWAEREGRVHELVAAAPVPDAAVLLPKAFALLLVLATLLAASVAAALGVEWARGHAGIRPGAYVSAYLLPHGVEWLLFAVLAVSLQAVSPGKLAGWGWTVLALIASFALERMGLVDGWYRYGRSDSAAAAFAASPEAPGPLGLSVPAWLRLYWTAFAVLLLALACAAWGRGTEPRTAARLAGLGRRMRGPLGTVALAAGVAVAAIGAALLGQAR